MASFPFHSDRAGRVPSRLLWVVAILLATTLWVVFTGILDTGRAADEVAVQRQRQQVGAAIERDLATRVDRVIELVLREIAEDEGLAATGARIDHLVTRLAQSGATDLAFAVRSDWSPVEGSRNLRSDGRPVGTHLKERAGPVIATVLSKFLSDAPGDVVESVRATRWASWRALHVFNETLNAGFVIPIMMREPGAASGSQNVVLLFARKAIATDELVRIGEAVGVHDLRLRADSERLPGAPTLPIVHADGTGGHELAWSSTRPGDIMRENLIPLTIGGFVVIAILFGAVTGYLLWQSRHLAAAEARARMLIGRDPLSGLSNRLLFNETLDRELARLGRGGDGVAVLFVDLDRFKDVNDTFGHKAGDHLIRLVAERLARTLRATDFLARFGGDEFAIIQVTVDGAEDAAALARRILEEISRPFHIDAHDITVGASIGIALAPRDGTCRETLMGLADTALYQAKTEGRNRYSFFQARMSAAIAMRKTVDEDLKRAIEEDELVLHYQPILAADGATIVGLEALVRWPHPQKGLISPAEFIPVAEQRGLIVPLGLWVLRRACLDGLRWPGLRIAVNVSPIQFRQRNFVELLRDVLDQTGFDPTRLELELTEGVVVEDADGAEAAMRALQALGVHLALDDFGTGYSSLIYLRRFAFDTIKIDRSFLESMGSEDDSAILVHSMVHLGRALGLKVTAEGVESVEQHRFLQALGCHQLQGYLFHKPLPAASIDALLASRPRVAEDAAA